MTLSQLLGAGEQPSCYQVPSCVPVGCLMYREIKEQAQPTEKPGEKMLEEMKILRGKALNSYLILG